MFNPENMVNNINELKRRMEDPNIDTGDDMGKYAREVMIPEMMMNAKGRPTDDVAASKAVINRYLSYL